MAYTTCLRCKEVFHLRLTSEQALAELRQKETEGNVLCIGCFKTIRLFDIVRVIAENSDVPEATVGETGTVVMLHAQSNNVDGYEVECVSKDGTSKWEGGFKREQLKWLQSPNE